MAASILRRDASMMEAAMRGTTLSALFPLADANSSPTMLNIISASCLMRTHDKHGVEPRKRRLSPLIVANDIIDRRCLSYRGGQDAFAALSVICSLHFAALFRVVFWRDRCAVGRRLPLATKARRLARREVVILTILTATQRQSLAMRASMRLRSSPVSNLTMPQTLRRVSTRRWRSPSRCNGYDGERCASSAAEVNDFVTYLARRFRVMAALYFIRRLSGERYFSADDSLLQARMPRRAHRANSHRCVTDNERHDVNAASSRSISTF